MSKTSGSVSRIFLSIAILAIVCSPAFAQVTSLGDETSPPVPGSGHDYIHGLNETVNPANGTLNINIQVPTPKGRGASLPFSFNYNSGSAIVPGMNGWTTNLGLVSKGGWSYGIPTWSFMQDDVPEAIYTCTINSGYIFQDTSGAAYSLGLDDDYPQPHCTNGTHSFARAGQYTAGLVYEDMQVADQDGNYYYFEFSHAGGITGSDAFFGYPSYIEDRNGNKVTFGGGGSAGAFTATDTLGTSLIASSGFGSTGDTVSVRGESNPYTMIWSSGNLTTSTPITATSVASYPSGCPTITSEGIDSPVIVQIQPPNSTLATPHNYSFDYDSTYGLINRITYPSGAYVRYDWGKNSAATFGIFGNIYGPTTACGYIYDTFAIQHRYVSYDGIHEVLQQDFTYSTTWTSGTTTTAPTWTNKSTTVKTTDNVSGVVGYKVYNYSNTFGSATEDTIVSEDASGNQVQKLANVSWIDGNTPGDQEMTICSAPLGPTSCSGITSKVITTDTFNGQIDERDEYDFDASTPTRKTIYTYQGFAASPLFRNNPNDPSYTTTSYSPTIFDRPCTVQVKDGSNNLYAETDYYYDGNNSTLCGTSSSTASSSVSSVPSGPAVSHDETNYAASTTNPRGNATVVVSKCLTVPGATDCSGETDATVTYNYDATGQITQVKDPCGNTTCSDITGSTTHTTTFTYTDSSPGNSAGQSNAYLTSVQDALGHTSTYAYNYSTSELSSETDPNLKSTTYSYDSILRLTDVYAPGSSQNSGTQPHTQIQRADGPTPGHDLSVTTTDPNGVVTKQELNGMGLVEQAITTSDAAGADTVRMVYDGRGNMYSQTNPYRGSLIPGNTTTYFYYDSLGRKVQQTQQDGTSNQYWSYSVNATAHTAVTTFTDESGQSWQQESDGLGRLKKVTEPGGLVTSYGYDLLGDLTSVTQTGVSGETARTRSYLYDGLSRIRKATNPETGVVSYVYDANGNVKEKDSPDPNLLKASGPGNESICYGYDVLNRLTSKLYDSSTGCASPSAEGATYVYEGSSTNNAVGRLVSALAKDTSGTTYSKTENYVYDELGRVTSMQQDLPPSLGASYTLGYKYDLGGNLTLSDSGYPAQPASPSNQKIQWAYSYDGAARLSGISSSWADSTHPVTVFDASNSGSTPSYGPTGLQNANLAVPSTTLIPGVTMARTYDNRMRVLSETDSGQVPSGTFSHSTGSISFTEASDRNGAAATGSIGISGSERYDVDDDADYGEVDAFIGSDVYFYDYGDGDDGTTVAAGLAYSINSGGTYTATSSSNSISITAISSGAAGNGSITFTCATYTAGFHGTSFCGNGHTGMTGGSDPDSGSFSTTINGNTSSAASWNSSVSASSLASTLAGNIQSASSGNLTASSSCSGTPVSCTISLTSTGTGASTNWPITLNATDTRGSSDPGYTYSPPSPMSGGSGSYGSGTIYSYSIPSSGGYDAVGDLLSVNDSINGSWSFSSGYDSLHRLTSAYVSSGPYTGSYLCWNYDSFGNRKAEYVGTSSCSPSSISDTATYTDGSNQMTWTSVGSLGSNPPYTASGALKETDSSHFIYYDNENRICAVAFTYPSPATIASIEKYLYDAEGNRVAKGSVNGPTSSDFNCGHSNVTWTSFYLAGQNGEMVSELDGSNNWIYSNVYSNGSLLATYTGNDLYLSLNDWLGSKRVVARADGYPCGAYANLPFGGGYSSTSTGICATPDPSVQHFTGNERDPQSDLDYFGARYYSSAMGRFMSPDPYGNSAVNPINPQSWNMYSYTLNNPLRFIDPTGLDCAYLDDKAETIESTDRNTTISECNSNGGYWVSGAVNTLTIDSDGGYHFGNSATDANGNLTVTVYDNYLGPTTDNSIGSAKHAAGQFLSDFMWGDGSTVRYYDMSTIEGRDLLRSKGIQQLNEKIKSGCAAGKQSGSVNLSTMQAAANLPYDSTHSPTGVQVGGYGGGTYENNGDSTIIKFTNRGGAHSFYLHAVPDRPEGSIGTNRTITQNFTLSEPNPCTHP